MKRIALIGHRGVGKSSLLKRVVEYFKNENILCLDLDTEIEKRAGRSIESIFATDGEAGFRKLEKNMFIEIDQRTVPETRPVFFALGAGFSPENIPESWTALWVRRTTDIDGRIFLDRPRLNTEISVIDEFRERYRPRQEAFRKRADEVLWIDEGLESANPAECDLILDRFSDLGGAITVMPELFRTPATLKAWIGQRLRWGVRWFELRDDLLSEEQITSVLKLIPKEKILISARSTGRRVSTEALIVDQSLSFDWPLEFGLCSFAEPRFLSLHERREGESITEALGRFPKTKSQTTCFKAALLTNDFKDLKEGHQWRHLDSQARVFLPMSRDGRWSWYRLLEGLNSELSFFRESDGSSTDQPTLLQWARVRRLNKTSPLKFAAVLGDPVRHSRTPLEQESFFASLQAPVLAIRVTQEEWREGALETLRLLGLRWAAVTAPLKELAFSACAHRAVPSNSLGTVNTLDLREGQWWGANTDLEGFRLAVEEIKKEEPLGSVAVWGGGGTLAVIEAIIPTAEFFSLRTQENRNDVGVRATEFQPDTVVWAGGGSQEQIPPEQWKPKQVLDLNYKEDSPARAYAQRIGCRYISGLAMFREQAQAQRMFWKMGMS